MLKIPKAFGTNNQGVANKILKDYEWQFKRCNNG